MTHLVLVPVLDRGHTAIAKGLFKPISVMDPTRRKTAKNAHHQHCHRHQHQNLPSLSTRPSAYHVSQHAYAHSCLGVDAQGVSAGPGPGPARVMDR